MNDSDWESRFKDLLEMDLIDADELYNEQLLFNDSEELDKIFTELEEKNLYYIHRLQEIEEQHEMMELWKAKVTRLKENEKSQQEENMMRTKLQIGDAQIHLDMLKQQNLGATMMESSKKDQGDKEKGTVIDVQKMLDDLRGEIERVHEDCLSTGIDMSSKKATDILNDIEIDVLHHIKALNDFEVKEPKLIAELEQN